MWIRGNGGQTGLSLLFVTSPYFFGDEVEDGEGRLLFPSAFGVAMRFFRKAAIRRGHPPIQICLGRLPLGCQRKSRVGVGVYLAVLAPKYC